MYLPKSKYKALVAKPGEFITEDGQQYIGPAIETFTGEYYSGTSPETAGAKIVSVSPVEVSRFGLYNIKRVPTEAEYAAGQMERYFVQERKTQKIIEVLPETWKDYYVQNDILRTWNKTSWRLTGDRDLVRVQNAYVVSRMEKAMPGIISSKVLWDPLQFYRKV